MHEIAERFRRSARNHQRLHLDVEHVGALLHAGFYEWIAQHEAEELLGALALNASNGDSSDSSGENP